MNMDSIDVIEAAVCLLFAGATVFNADEGADAPVREIDPSDTVFKWPSVTGGGEVEFLEQMGAEVKLGATSMDEDVWSFQYWIGPDGLIDPEPVKTFALSETGNWTAVFTEVST